jgi:hypothetical protein
MNGVQKDATSDGGAGGQYVGWTEAGDWMAYNSINIPTSGSYLIEYRVASQNGGGRLSLDLNAGAVQLGAVNIPSTGGWQNWTTVSHTVTINAGTYNFGIFVQAGGFNINWFKITKQGSTARIAHVNEIENTTADFEFYPNPAEVAIYVKSSLDIAGGQAKVYDGMGIEVVSTILDSGAVDITSLKAGIYTLVVSKDGNKFSRRFMKH